MTHFFISYSKKDTRELALTLNDALNTLPGVTSWVDTSLRAGKSWETQIQAEIDRCDYMIVLYSPDVNRHKRGEAESYVLTEIAYAKYTAKKTIIPVMAQKTDAPLSLTTSQYIDYISRGMTFEQLVTAVCAEAGITPPAPHGIKEQNIAAAPPQKSPQAAAAPARQKKRKTLRLLRPLLLLAVVAAVIVSAVTFRNISIRNYSSRLCLPGEISSRGAAQNGQSTTVPTAAPTPFGGGSGQIMFTSDQGGDHEIYIMNGDGTNPCRITDNTADDLFPDWSPDGSKIAFTSDRLGNNEIYVMNADGSNTQRLTNDPSLDWMPSWSPDGTQIAYMSFRSGDWIPYLIDVDGSNSHSLLDNAQSYGKLAWSPDGTKIAFVSFKDGNAEIYAININNGNIQRLTNNTAKDTSPAWSPDGLQIAFVSEREFDKRSRIYIMDADGGFPIYISTKTGVDAPAWSPDGTQIVFILSDDSSLEIYSMNASGRNILDLTGGANPTWRPS
ncbi:MAG: TIR domain-containing protein [Chloroflexota bacterium]